KYCNSGKAEHYELSTNRFESGDHDDQYSDSWVGRRCLGDQGVASRPYRSYYQKSARQTWSLTASGSYAKIDIRRSQLRVNADQGTGRRTFGAKIARKSAFGPDFNVARAVFRVV